MIKIATHTVITIGLLTLLMAKHANAQKSNTAAALVPVVSLLLSGDACIRVIRPGDVIFDSLDPECSSEGREPGTFAQYFSFTHPGGPLHVDLLNDFPTLNGFGFNPYLVLREEEARDGAIIVEDNNGHENFRGAQIRLTVLAPGRYTLQATAQNNSNASASPFILSVYTGRVTANATGKLNDTGIAFAGTSLSSNSVSCNGSNGFANQDCDFGRDNNLSIGRGSPENDNDGADGFSFLRVAADGSPIRAVDIDENFQASAPLHACVKDNVTGLMWEVKTNSGMDIRGLHDARHNYSWYNTNSTENDGDVGIENGGACFNGEACDTQGFVSAVNETDLCGYDDWRMPTVTELQGLVNYQVASPLIDTNFFPNAPSSGSDAIFWSASPDQGSINRWAVLFEDGDVSLEPRNANRSVRLVRGGSPQ